MVQAHEYLTRHRRRDSTDRRIPASEIIGVHYHSPQFHTDICCDWRVSAGRSARDARPLVARPFITLLPLPNQIGKRHIGVRQRYRHLCANNRCRVIKRHSAGRIIDY